MAMLGVNDLLALNSLLSERHDEFKDGSSSRDSALVTPGSFGAPRKGAVAAVPESTGSAALRKAKDPKDIWDEDEVPPEDAISVEDVRDTRPRPR